MSGRRVLQLVGGGPMSASVIETFPTKDSMIVRLREVVERISALYTMEPVGESIQGKPRRWKDGVNIWRCQCGQMIAHLEYPNELFWHGQPIRRFNSVLRQVRFTPDDELPWGAIQNAIDAFERIYDLLREEYHAKRLTNSDVSEIEALIAPAIEKIEALRLRDNRELRGRCSKCNIRHDIPIALLEDQIFNARFSRWMAMELSNNRGEETPLKCLIHYRFSKET